MIENLTSQNMVDYKFHRFCVMWHTGGGERCLKISGPYLLRFKSKGDLKIFSQRVSDLMNQLMNNKAVSRTSPAPLCLLISIHQYLFWWWVVYQFYGRISILFLPSMTCLSVARCLHNQGIWAMRIFPLDGAHRAFPSTS